MTFICKYCEHFTEGICQKTKEKKTENTYCGSRNFTQRRKNNGTHNDNT